MGLCQNQKPTIFYWLPVPCSSSRKKNKLTFLIHFFPKKNQIHLFSNKFSNKFLIHLFCWSWNKLQHSAGNALHWCRENPTQHLDFDRLNECSGTTLGSNIKVVQLYESPLSDTTQWERAGRKLVRVPDPLPQGNLSRRKLTTIFTAV